MNLLFPPPLCAPDCGCTQAAKHRGTAKLAERETREASDLSVPRISMAAVSILMTTITLAPRVLRRLKGNQNEKTFKFIVGENSYPCHWFVAELLSPVVAELREHDSTIDCYEIGTKNCEFIIEGFLSIGYGEDFFVDESSFGVFSSLCVELGNFDFCLQLTDQRDPLTAENVLDRIGKKRIFCGSILKEIEFAAAHFHELSRNELEQLNVDDFSEIISNESLRLVSEDSLYDIVCHFVCESSDNFWLFEFIQFEYLSRESISSFIEVSQERFALSFNLSIWKRICVRLLEGKISGSGVNRFVNQGLRIEFDSNSPLNGIISHLAREHGGNVHDVGIVEVTASSVYSNYAPRNAVDMTENSCFGSANKPDGWLCYDFKDSLIRPTHYSFRSRHTSWDKGAELVSWVIETSNDKATWTEIDRHSNDRTSLGAIRSFSISKSCDPSRFIRIRQTGKTANGSWDHLLITSLEFFGCVIQAAQ